MYYTSYENAFILLSKSIITYIMSIVFLRTILVHHYKSFSSLLFIFLFFLSFLVLFVSVLVFSATASWILSDNRRRLIQSVRLYQPSFLYAYLALLMQGGVIQVSVCDNFTLGPSINDVTNFLRFHLPLPPSCHPFY